MKTIINNVITLFVAPIAFGFAAGCQVTSEGEGCTPNVKPGLSINVFDAETGLPAGCGASAVVTEGSYLEQMTIEATPICVDTSHMVAAYERVGTYQIVVSKPGYLDETVSDVDVVMTDGCSVDTTVVNVMLTPSP